MNSAPPDHADFPVLTEVLETEPLVLRDAEEPHVLAPAAARPPEVDWALLAMRIEQQVSERLLQRCNALLEEQIPETLAPLLARAAEQISQDLRTAVPLMVRNLVVTAVAEELDRLHAAPNDRP